MVGKLTCIIVEDEVLARKSLSALCQKIEVLDLIGTFESASEALKEIPQIQPDLIFLDIEMPGMSGLEMIDELSSVPQIVFTTGNKDYAFEAFEYDVTDFLKKPITQGRFIKAVEKAQLREDRLKEIAKVSEERECYVRSEGRLIRITYDTLQYIEYIGDYVKMVTDHGHHVVHGSLKSIDQKIKNPRFLKVHRSYIINLDKVVDIEDNSIVIGKKVIPVSRAHKGILLSSINIL